MIKIIAVLLLSYASFVRAEYESMKFPVKKLKSFGLTNVSGKVSIYSSEEEQVVVEFEKMRFPKSCELKISQDFESLKVKILEKRKSLDEESCLVHFRVRIPASFNVNIINGIGPVEFLGINGKLNYQVGSGDIQIDGEPLEVLGRVGNGKQTFRGYSSAMSLNSGRGSFRIELSKLLPSGKLELKNGTGDAQVLAPESSDLNARLQSGLGKLFNEFPPAKNKDAFAISMKSGTGALRVKAQ